MGFLGMPRSEGAAEATETHWARGCRSACSPRSASARGSCRPTSFRCSTGAVAPLAHESAVAALVPPFFARPQAQQALPPAFVAEFHDLGAQVGRDVLAGQRARRAASAAKQQPGRVRDVDVLHGCRARGHSRSGFRRIPLLSLDRALARGPVWAGGLRRLTPGITYTATGFSNPVRVIFQAIVLPPTAEDSIEAVARISARRSARTHPRPISSTASCSNPRSALGTLAAIVRKMHVGHVNAYAAYVLLAMLVVLVLGARAF